MNMLRYWLKTILKLTIQRVIRKRLRAIGVAIIGDPENIAIVVPLPAVPFPAWKS